MSFTEGQPQKLRSLSKLILKPGGTGGEESSSIPYKAQDKVTINSRAPLLTWFEGKVRLRGEAEKDRNKRRISLEKDGGMLK